ncbi:MAG: hypothetical protein U0791_23380 [Gemmataceae bacterium]
MVANSATEPVAEPAVWAVVELMGHVKLAGRLTEEEKFGAKLGRIDIPTGKPCSLADCESHQIAPDACPECHGAETFITKFFGGGSIYSVTIVSEAVARHIAKKSHPEPVHSWDFPKQLIPANTFVDDHGLDDGDDE